MHVACVCSVLAALECQYCKGKTRRKDIDINNTNNNIAENNTAHLRDGHVQRYPSFVIFRYIIIKLYVALYVIHVLHNSADCRLFLSTVIYRLTHQKKTFCKW